jgi:hypothetical protein
VQKEVCSDFLSCYEAGGESFSSWVGTQDETWIHHVELQAKDSEWNGII